MEGIHPVWSSQAYCRVLSQWLGRPSARGTPDLGFQCSLFRHHRSPCGCSNSIQTVIPTFIMPSKFQLQPKSASAGILTGTNKGQGTQPEQLSVVSWIRTVVQCIFGSSDRFIQPLTERLSWPLPLVSRQVCRSRSYYYCTSS